MKLRKEPVKIDYHWGQDGLSKGRAQIKKISPTKKIKKQP